MIIKSAEIVMSAVKPSQYPEVDFSEFAFVGRSNVGKSSLINLMLNRKKLARTSSSPGKTRTINFFLINEAFHFVDLPGYGYAKISKTEKAKWGEMIEIYLSSRENLKEVFLLVDLRHKPSKDDVLMYNWLKHYGYGKVVIATKFDKIKKSKVQVHLKDIRNTLEMDKDSKIIPVSALNRIGQDKVMDEVISRLESTTST